MSNGEQDTPASGAPGDHEMEIALTFSYEPEATMDELFGISEEALFEAFELALDAINVDRSVEVSVLVTTDEGIRALNRDYRGKDEATDVLSFPLLDEPLVDAPADELWQAGEQGDGDESGEIDDEDEGVWDEDEPFDSELEEDEDEDEDGDDEDEEDDEDWPLHLGDIAIARETVIRQSQSAGHSAAYETAFLCVHGVLHLVGYDDHTAAGYRAMVAIQETVLAQAGISR
ncbi:MAG TPA: rRNA maturation RNase YbeY [Ktedonobacterales bacterium]